MQTENQQQTDSTVTMVASEYQWKCNEKQGICITPKCLPDKALIKSKQKSELRVKKPSRPTLTSRVVRQVNVSGTTQDEQPLTSAPFLPKTHGLH